MGANVGVGVGVWAWAWAQACARGCGVGMGVEARVAVATAFSTFGMPDTPSRHLLALSQIEHPFSVLFTKPPSRRSHGVHGKEIFLRVAVGHLMV